MWLWSSPFVLQPNFPNLDQSFYLETNSLFHMLMKTLPQLMDGLSILCIDIKITIFGGI